MKNGVKCWTEVQKFNVLITTHVKEKANCQQCVIRIHGFLAAAVHLCNTTLFPEDGKVIQCISAFSLTSEEETVKKL